MADRTERSRSPRGWEKLTVARKQVEHNIHPQGGFLTDGLNSEITMASIRTFVDNIKHGGAGMAEHQIYMMIHKALYTGRDYEVKRQQEQEHYEHYRGDWVKKQGPCRHGVTAALYY